MATRKATVTDEKTRRTAADYKPPPTLGWTLIRGGTEWSIWLIFDQDSITEVVRDQMRGPNPPVPRQSVPAANILHREVRSIVAEPASPVTELGDIRAQLREHINHYFIGHPNHPKRNPQELAWWYSWMRNGTAIGNGRETVLVEGLSAAARRAIDAFNGLATELVTTRYILAVHALTDGAPSAPSFAKWKVFISYRKSHEALAPVVRSLFKEFGGGAHFVTFLDQDDTEMGDWMHQYKQAIQDCDVFVPLCSHDYAAGGSVSESELLHAEKLGKHIAPIRLGSDRPAVWKRLGRLHAALVPSADDLSMDNSEVAEYLRVVLQSLESGTDK